MIFAIDLSELNAVTPAIVDKSDEFKATAALTLIVSTLVIVAAGRAAAVPETVIFNLSLPAPPLMVSAAVKV